MAYYAKKTTAGFPEIHAWDKEHGLSVLISHPIIAAAIDLHKDIRAFGLSDKFDNGRFAWWLDQVFRSSLSIATNFSEYLAKSYTLPVRISRGEAYETMTSLRVTPTDDEELSKNLILKCKKVIDLLDLEMLKIVGADPDWDVKD